MIYHVIDHQGFGTIHKLLIPLCEKYSNHKIVNYDDLKLFSKILCDDNCIIIIHSTASKKSGFLYKFLDYFANKNVYIFMHVSANYQLYKGRKDVLLYLKQITQSYKNIIVLTPSKEVTQQYINYGICAETIQLGVDIDCFDIKYNPLLESYYNKIITTCSSDNPQYKYVKGIDIYEKFIVENNLYSSSLIAGINTYENNKILCKKFNEEDFLNILAHSKMYIQFSRYESYNLTATYSKILQIPVLLINSEGNFSCMNGMVYNEFSKIEDDALKILNGYTNCKIIKELYYDSIFRENIDNFNAEFLKLKRRRRK